MAPASGSPRLALVAAAVTLSSALVLGMAATAAAEPSPTEAPPVVPTTSGQYIVSLAAQPLAAYDGGVAGYAATRPREGEELDLSTPNARRYRTYLQREQDRIAQRAGIRPAQRYAVGLTGFTATLTAEQARLLARTPGVLGVSKDVLRKAVDDRNSVDYLKLSGPGGVWQALGGTGRAGRGVVVGVLDNGIWPESRSFAGAPLTAAPNGSQPYRRGDRIVYRKSDGGTFVGTCQPGEQFDRSDCNTKLIGARYYGDAWLERYAPATGSEFVSPRDGAGHGSHTASTAAGNAGVRAEVDGRNFGKISGVAPAAKIAAYKVLWESDNPAENGGFTSDIVMALEQAITDNVDVINFSIGDASEDGLLDPVPLMFLSAASAGIFVAAAGGNSGPGPSTVENTAPWVTTVAANTIAPYYGTVELGNGRRYAGVSTTVNRRVGPAPLINGSAAAAADSSPAQAAVCAPNSLDEAKVSGKIVVCDRGVVDRMTKSIEVKRAGGIGCVLANLTQNSLDADVHAVPTVHVNPPASEEIKIYAGNPGATATLVQGNTTSDTIPYPQVAGSSSRGPSLANTSDVLKPDLTAPGVAILAAVAPPSNYGRNFDFYSGTSMSAPHVAGLAALYYGVRPRWSPMKVKSALMTTARNTKTETGAANTDPYSQGAGEVVPTRMFDPGLVYPAGDRDWLAYLEGQGVDTETGVRAKDPSDYNAPSIAIGALAGRQTVTRRVTAVKPGRYRATASVDGVDVRVSPSILSFGAAGQTSSFRVTFTRRTAPFDKAATGFLTWRGAGTSVRIPIAVVPTVVDAPAQITGSGAAGTVDFSVTPGISGAFPITPAGLASGPAQPGSVAEGQNRLFESEIPANTKVAQFTVRTPDSGADLDLFVLDQDGNLVGQSATTGANETVSLPAPAAGRYTSIVNGYANAPGTSTTAFTHRAAVVRAGAGQGNFTVSPRNPTARAGRPINLQASWSGLDATTPYAGWIEYPDGSGTTVTIN